MRCYCPVCGNMMIRHGRKHLRKDELKRCLLCRKNWSKKELEDYAETRDAKAEIENGREKAITDFKQSVR